LVRTNRKISFRKRQNVIQSLTIPYIFHPLFFLCISLYFHPQLNPYFSAIFCRIFSFLITLRLMLHERKSISSEELRFLMVLPPCSHLPLPPCPPYFTNKQWSILNELANTVIGFHGLEKDFIDNGEQWAKVWENQNLL
jgi:hypothetical protein